AQREKATLLFTVLNATSALLEQGERDAAVIRDVMQRLISAEPLARLDYVSIADPITLHELNMIDTGAIVSLAVYFGNTRLIDNLHWEL
ncbi:MAG: pantoate--beta-alanine ligase, partial [Candidatus Promineifilaceae bacterium]